MWKFLPRPIAAAFDAGSVETDDLLTYGADAVINMACVELAEILKEWDMVKAYQSRALEAIELLKNEDRRRRQGLHYNIKHEDF